MPRVQQLAWCQTRTDQGALGQPAKRLHFGFDSIDGTFAHIYMFIVRVHTWERPCDSAIEWRSGCIISLRPAPKETLEQHCHRARTLQRYRLVS